VTERQHDDSRRRWQKTHVLWALERGRELESERRRCCGGWESSRVYIGGRGSVGER
jgi:hypothetical protein